MKKLLLINGPNLNRLGKREPEVYGYTTLQDLEEELTALARDQNIELICFQSNHEGEIIDVIQETEGKFDGIIMNPGAFTHYSIAIRDAIASVSTPLLEVHISNIHAREEFRHKSVISPVAIGQIVGLGLNGYKLAIFAMREHIEKE